MPKLSLRSRLVATLVAFCAVGLIASSIFINHELQQYLLDRIDRQLVAGTATLAAPLGGDGMRPPPNPNNPSARGPAQQFPPGTFGTIYNTNGTVISSRSFGFNAQGSNGSAPVLPPASVNKAQQSPTFVTTQAGGEDFRVYARATPNGEVVAVGMPLQEVNATVSALRWLELGIGLGVTVLLGGLSYLVIRRELRPLARMSQTATAIANSDPHELDLTQRVDDHSGGTEVAHLGQALNTMLSEIDAAFTAQAEATNRLREFVSDASHELRTPLTSIRGYAEMFDRGANEDPDDLAKSMRRIQAESARMSDLVDDLLLLARLDQTRSLSQSSVLLNPLVNEVAADFRIAYPANVLTVEVPAHCLVQGDDRSIRQILGNLLRNAAIHTPQGTPVEIEVIPESQFTELRVIDHGEGIPPTIAAKLFDRFTRAESSRARDSGGAGLGLSIVAALAEAQSGTVWATETPGGGATFHVRLPTLA